MTKQRTTGEGSKLELRVDSTMRELPREVKPRKDLWPGIRARIDTPAENRFGRLPRDIEPSSDLWPGIHSRLGARLPDDCRIAGARFATATGVLTVVALTAMIGTQLGDFSGAESAMSIAIDSERPAATAELPDWMAEMLRPFAVAGADTRTAALGETARAIQRDFLMVRSERFRIERVLAASPNDTNLRTQWRHVYVTELRLIDEAQRLGTFYGMRSAI